MKHLTEICLLLLLLIVVGFQALPTTEVQVATLVADVATLQAAVSVLQGTTIPTTTLTPTATSTPLVSVTATFATPTPESMEHVTVFGTVNVTLLNARRCAGVGCTLSGARLAVGQRVELIQNTRTVIGTCTWYQMTDQRWIATLCSGAVYVRINS